MPQEECRVGRNDRKKGDDANLAPVLTPNTLRKITILSALHPDWVLWFQLTFIQYIM